MAKLKMIGVLAGVAAAGVAAGMAAERKLVGRTRRGGDDPYADEPFGRLPFDETLLVPTPDGFDIYVEVLEPNDGVALEFGDEEPEPTLVFAHGFCLDMGTFHLQRRYLDAGQYRMVFYDQPGHGRSGRLQHGEYELPMLGEVLRDVIDATTPRGRVVLIGHSMGGMAIMACAEKFPELFEKRIAGVVLISTSGGRSEAGKLGGIPEMMAGAGPLLQMVGGATRYTGGVIDRARHVSSDLAWLLTRRYGFGGRRPSPSLVSYVEAMNSRTPIDTVTRYLRTLYSHARYPALAAIRDKPVLVICGDKDPILPVAHSQELVRYLPDAELVVVPDSGHVVLLEHADEVNAVLQDFLDRVVG